MCAASVQKAASNKAYVPDHLLALVHYALGDPVQGRAFLKKGIDKHNGLLVWMRGTPVFDQIAADPEGKKLLMQVGGSLF